MLTNASKLGYKAKSANESYTDLPGLKELPDWGGDPEKVENTCLSDTHKQYEIGIGDLGDVKYKFKYENGAATSAYRILQKQGI